MQVPSVYDAVQTQSPSGSITREEEVREESNKEKMTTGIYDVPRASKDMNLRMSQNISYAATTAAIKQETKFN